MPENMHDFCILDIYIEEIYSLHRVTLLNVYTLCRGTYINLLYYIILKK